MRRKTVCKVRAQLLIPSNYGDSTNTDEIFNRALKHLYPEAIEEAIERNHLEASANDFSYEIDEPKHATRIVYFYLSSYIDCNCRNVQDTLLNALHANFLDAYPDARTIRNEALMSRIADQLDSLQYKLEYIKKPEDPLDNLHILDSMKVWEQQWTKLMEEKTKIQISEAAYLYEFFTVLNSGNLLE